MNDVSGGTEQVKVYLFADDILIISLHKNYTNMMNNLQDSFDDIVMWCNENEVAMNLNKTQFICIQSAQRLRVNGEKIYKHSVNHINCNKECTIINEVEDAKYLGLIIDNKWGHKNHILSIIKKLRRMMPNLYKLKNILDNTNKLKVYYSWIESILRYGIEVYGHAKHSHLLKLQKIQNKVIKILFKQNDMESTKDIYIRTKLLNIKQLREFCIIYNNYFNRDYKEINKDKANLFRNTTYRYNVPKCNNDYGKRCRQYNIPMLFNKLPLALTTLASYSGAKKELKKFLLQNVEPGLF